MCETRREARVSGRQLSTHWAEGQLHGGPQLLLRICAGHSWGPSSPHPLPPVCGKSVRRATNIDGQLTAKVLARLNVIVLVHVNSRQIARLAQRGESKVPEVAGERSHSGGQAGAEPAIRARIN